MFIMKKIHFVLIFSLFAVTAKAQYNLSFKTGLAWGNIDVVADARAVDLNSYRDEPNYQFALTCTRHLTKEFCIGAETGLNSFAHFFIYQVPDPLGNIGNYNGRYEIKQAYLAFVPEYRPFSWLYLNGGLGVFADVRSRFTQGYAKYGTQERPLRGTEFRRGNPLGGFLGMGLNPRVYRNMSLVVEGRLVACPATRKLEYITAIGYAAAQINIGLHFMIDGKKK